MTDTTKLATAVATAKNAQKRGRPLTEYDTPNGIFFGLEAAALGNKVSVSTVRNRLKDSPHCWYDTAEDAML